MNKHKWKDNTNKKLFSDIDESIFKNHSFKTVSSYAIGVYFFLILKVALLASDLYTCIKLLAYNTWSNDVIKPYLPFRISKWLFSACILLSIVFLLWNVVSGFRAYRTNNITICYINNFARNCISLKDYAKFCVFHKISSNGVFQWFAFYVFFEIKDCLGLIFCDTPRQVINGLTLWSVLITIHNGEGMSLGDLETFDGLINKIKAIAEANHEEAVLLCFNLLSFVIWTFFISKLILALVCSIFIYFKLIRDAKYNGLREYIYTTINAHVDDLVIKQTEKRRIETYKTHLLTDTSSMLELEDLNRDINRSKPIYKLYNDSMNSLHKVGHSNLTTTNYDDSGIIEEVDAFEEPVPLLSTIGQQGDLFKQNYYRDRAIVDSTTVDNLVEEILESYGTKHDYLDGSTANVTEEEFSRTGNLSEKPSFANAAVQVKTVTTPSFKKTPDINIHNTLVPHGSMNTPSQIGTPNLNRPIPPNLFINPQLDTEDKNNIYTPDRAYFRNIDLENSPFLPPDEAFDNSFTGRHQY